jgi:hypothetical protein
VPCYKAFQRGFVLKNSRRVAGADFAAGADEGGPVAGCVGGGEEDFDLAAGVLLASRVRAAGVEAGGDDAAVVEDEEVAGVEEGWEVLEVEVGEGAILMVPQGPKARCLMYGLKPVPFVLPRRSNPLPGTSISYGKVLTYR